MVTLRLVHRGLLAGSVLLSALSGCGPRAGYPEVHEQVVMRTDFEEPASPLPDSRTTTRAHSGRVATVVDSTHEFSETYRMQLGRLFSRRPRKLRLSAWVWVPRYEDDADLVVKIVDPNDASEPLFYQSMYLSDKGPYQQWKRVSQDFDLPEELQSSTELSIYAWRGGAKQPIYLDDWELVEIH